MIIALDYDGTYTRDAELWLAFIKAAHANGHKVICVTMRHLHETKDADFDPRLAELVQVFPTSRKAKKQFMRMQGWKVDIWIDDNPDWLYSDSK